MLSDMEKAVLLSWQLLRRIVRWIIIIVAGSYIFYRIRTTVLSVMIAVLLTYALLPWVDGLCRRHRTRLKPRTQRCLASLLVLIVFLGFVAGGIALMIHPFRIEMDTFKHNLDSYSKTITTIVSSAGSWYERAVPEQIKHIVEKLDYSKLTSGVSGYVQGVIKFTTSSIGIIVELLLIPVLAFYFLMDHRMITREVYGLVPRPRRREALRIGRMVGEILQSYIFGQIILCIIAGVLTGIILAVLHVPYVLVLALFAGITRAIPVIGPVVSGVPIVLVGAINFPGNLSVPLYLAIFAIFMHFAESKFIMPRLIGDRLHLQPAVVIIVLLIGAEFFGIMGMFLAPPVAAVICELIRMYYIRPKKNRERAMIEKAKSKELVETQS